MNELVHTLTSIPSGVYAIVIGLIGFVKSLLVEEKRHELAITRDKRAEIVAAGKDFWEEASLSGLSLLSGHDLRSAIIKLYEPQNRAADKFRNALPEGDRLHFDAYWQEYINYRHRHFDLSGLNEHLERLRVFTDPV